MKSSTKAALRYFGIAFYTVMFVLFALATVFCVIGHQWIWVYSYGGFAAVSLFWICRLRTSESVENLSNKDAKMSDFLRPEFHDADGDT